MKLYNTYLCFQCDEIFDINASKSCPSCTSNAIQPLSNYVHPLAGRQYIDESRIIENKIKSTEKHNSRFFAIV